MARAQQLLLLALLALARLPGCSPQLLPPGSFANVVYADTSCVQSVPVSVVRRYSFIYTASASGSHAFIAAFRHDPGFWTFSAVSLKAPNGVDLLINGNFAYGGSVVVSGNPATVNAPAAFGVFYQTGNPPKQQVNGRTRNGMTAPLISSMASSRA